MESTPATYAAAYRRAYDEAVALAGPLSPARFNWKPSPEAWSVAECLVHLNVTNAPYLPALEEALEAALAKGGPKGAPPFRYGWLARRFIAANGPQPGRKAKTLARMSPPGGADYAADRVLADFKALSDGFLALLERAEAERLDLARIRIGSPFLPILRLPAGAFLEALARHERRHLAQARRVIEAPGFPET